MFPFRELRWHQHLPKKTIIDIEEMSNPLSTASRLLSCDSFTTADQLLAREKNGLSLTTRNGSGILINPPVSEELQLHNWYNETRAEIDNLINQKAYRNTDMLLPAPPQTDVVPISTYLAALETRKTAWVGGKMTVQPQDSSYTQTACANCSKPLEADLTCIVQCPSCKTECEIQLILRVAVLIEDGTGAVKTMLTSPVIEKFVAVTPLQIKDAEEAGENIQNMVEKELNGQPIVAFARAYDTTYQHQPETKIFLVNAHKTKDSKKRKAPDT